MMILSGDPPRSRVLSSCSVIIAALALTPFLFPGAKAMNVATKICIFAALVASYDLLLGYTGSVSFAHTMFYGIGSYSIAIALYSMGRTGRGRGRASRSACRWRCCWRSPSDCSRCGSRRSSSR
jgi:branched-chain amino acid transport system permease protein